MLGVDADDDKYQSKGKVYVDSKTRILQGCAVISISCILFVAFRFTVGSEGSSGSRRSNLLDTEVHTEAFLCSRTVQVHVVGKCEPEFIWIQDCQAAIEDGSTPYDHFVEEVENRFSGKTLREVTVVNGARVAKDSYIPAKVWILFGVEQFAFPACAIGDVYKVGLPSSNRTVSVEVLSTDPKVLVADNFLTSEECKEIIEVGKSRLGPSTVSAQGKGGGSFKEESRTSSTAWLQPSSYRIAAALAQRVSDLIGVPLHSERVVFEDLQLLRYEVTQHYHIHHDWFDPKQFAAFVGNDGRNRYVTVLFYLNDVEEGGATTFPMAGDPRPLMSYTDCSRGIQVYPKEGRVVIFYNLHPELQTEGGLDEAAWHAGCDVIKGTKWAANFWITMKGVHPVKS